MKVMKCLSSNEGLDWTLGSEYGGLKAFYQKQEDGSISACVHGQQDDVPIFEQVAILSDVERYSAWIPLISQSNLLAMPGNYSLASFSQFR